VPFLITHADADDLVSIEQSIALHTALTQAGVPSKLCINEGGGHMRANCDPAAIRAFCDLVLPPRSAPTVRGPHLSWPVARSSWGSCCTGVDTCTRHQPTDNQTLGPSASNRDRGVASYGCSIAFRKATVATIVSGVPTSA
jgi:hypothetical protein